MIGGQCRLCAAGRIHDTSRRDLIRCSRCAQVSWARHNQFVCEDCEEKGGGRE